MNKSQIYYFIPRDKKARSAGEGRIILKSTVECVFVRVQYERTSSEGSIPQV